MLYKDEKVLFQPAVRNKDTIHIPMAMISDDKKLAMLYKLHKAGESWKIYDVEIEGVSILLTYRSQFNDILSRGSVDDLISQLEKPAGS
jgi:phospholipid transport system substrate-binding protein